MSSQLITATVAPGRGVIARNTASLILAYVVPRGLTFAAGIVAARMLGTSEYGLYTTAAALAVMVSIIASLGMQPLLVREIARAPGDSAGLVSAAHVAKLISVTVMVVALAATSLLGFPGQIMGAAILLG